MAIANSTTASDLIVPEVWGDMVSAELPSKIKFYPLADVDTTLQGQPGDSFKFGQWGYIGDAVIVPELTDIPMSKLTKSEASATIAKAGKGVVLSDEAVLSGLGNPLGEGVTQVALACRSKIDADLATTARTAAGESVTDPFSIDAAAAALGLFDDYETDQFAGFVISNQARVAVMTDDRFVAVSAAGADATIVRGQIGTIWGVPVIVSNKAAAGALLIEKGALGLAIKRNVLVEKDRDTVNKSTIVTADVHYATYAQKPSGIVKFAADVAGP